jgi:hypothetical protein
MFVYGKKTTAAPYVIKALTQFELIDLLFKKKLGISINKIIIKGLSIFFFFDSPTE